MAQNVPQQPTPPTFDYAGLETQGDFLPELKLEEGKKALVSFLKDIPYMENPPFVRCAVHWNSEMGDNGRMFQCFGGSCCQQITWQKGWGGEPGKFEPNKARKRYFIPLVHYCQDETNPAATKAMVKHLNLTWSAYDALVKAVQNNVEGLDFFERDITLEATKVNGATVYLFHKGESLAQWKQNPVFKQQVEEQLPNVAFRLANAMPKTMTEAEFMEMKPQLDAKVKAAMASHNAVQQNAVPQYTQGVPQYQGVPQGVPQTQGFNLPPQTPVYQQPQVNIPVATPIQAQSSEQLAAAVQQVEQPTQTTVEEVAQPTQEPTVPQVTLSFDPNQVLK